MARSPSPRREARGRSDGSDGRAPWLEEADPDEAEATLIGRRTLLGLLVALLALVGIVAAGLWLVSDRADGPADIPADGEVPLVTSPGPWRLPAEGPGVEGTPVEGQGQLMFPVGEGQAPDGRIDAARLPEEPVPPGPAGAEVSPGPPTDLLGPPEVSDWPEPEPSGGPARPSRRTPEPPPTAPASAPEKPAVPAAAAAGAAAVPATAGGGGGTVQLGAFSSEAAARRAFADLAARHPELKGVSPQISRTGDAERMLWRVRARLGEGVAPRAFCDRLRVAGDACTEVR